MSQTAPSDSSLRRRLVRGSILIGVAVPVLLLAFIRPWRERITPENVGLIRIGMPDAELKALLGEPHFEAKELGHVRSPTSFTINVHYSPKELRERGHRDYLRRQWTSTQAGVVVISDTEGKVVCRYDVAPSKSQSFWRDLLRWF